MTTVHRGNWHEAMALLAHPQAAGDALSLLGHLVDDIWYLAGDKSHDYNWYTKRASLAFIYKVSKNLNDVYVRQYVTKSTRSRI